MTINLSGNSQVYNIIVDNEAPQGSAIWNDLALTSDPVNATGVCWGSMDPDVVETQTWHHYDDPALGQVDLSGMIDCVFPAPTVTPTPLCLHHGDINGDELITSEDAQLTFMIVLGAMSPTYEEACAADCNADSEVTAEDAQMIFLDLLGMGECEDEVKI